MRPLSCFALSFAVLWTVQLPVTRTTVSPPLAEGGGGDGQRAQGEGQGEAARGDDAGGAERCEAGHWSLLDCAGSAGPRDPFPWCRSVRRSAAQPRSGPSRRNGPGSRNASDLGPMGPPTMARVHLGDGRVRWADDVDDLVRVHPPARCGAHAARRRAAWFARGCRLDGAPAGLVPAATPHARAALPGRQPGHPGRRRAWSSAPGSATPSSGGSSTGPRPSRPSTSRASSRPTSRSSPADGSLPASSVDRLDGLLRAGPLGDLIVSLRVWAPSGTVVYGSIRELVGQTFPIKGELAEAFDGQVTADLSDLTASENAVERRQWSRLLEMYLPVRRQRLRPDRRGRRVLPAARRDRSGGRAGAPALVGPRRRGDRRVVPAALRDRQAGQRHHRPPGVRAHAPGRRALDAPGPELGPQREGSQGGRADDHPERAGPAPHQRRPARRAGPDPGPCPDAVRRPEGAPTRAREARPRSSRRSRGRCGTP